MADREVDKMLEKEVIRPSRSPWCSPIVMAPKKDGGYRFCVDYRKLNTITKKDSYPLPRIDDIFDLLNGACFFSSLDQAWGFWQIPVAEPDKEKTAFITYKGLYEFNVLPFGLCNAPATFQRLMDMLLAGLQWNSCLVYLDDILIFGKDFEEHLTRLRSVLLKIGEAGLKLRLRKCKFFLPEISYLGHKISHKGISPDPEKVSTVQDFPIPTNLREARGFLGLASYYRRFIPAFALIASPLHNLMRKQTDFHWDDKCQKAFENKKTRLISAPVLIHPRLDKKFVLQTDASGIGIGVILLQGAPGGGGPGAGAGRGGGGAGGEEPGTGQE